LTLEVVWGGPATPLQWTLAGGGNAANKQRLTPFGIVITLDPWFNITICLPLNSRQFQSPPAPAKSLLSA